MQAMKAISEKTYYLYFRIGIILKGAIAVGELAIGCAFALFDYATLKQIAFALSGDELSESPRDLVWNYVVQALHGFTTTPQSIWAFIFLSHGIIKIFLIIALLRDKLWAYPASAVVFTLFIVYQCYQLSLTPSFILWIITILDIVVVGLIIHEYRRRREGLAVW